MSIFLPLLKTKNIYRFIQANDYVIFDDLYILKNIFLLKIFKVLTKRSYYYAVGYLFNSIYTYERFIEVSARKDVPLAIVHPALNPKIFSNQNIRELNQINICIIARKHTWKGFVDFIKVYKDIQNMIKINNVYIISHDDLSEFDLSEVELIQPKSDHEIAHYMNKSHIFISTSWWEGFGLPPLEAMACGCSVILTDAGGVNEYAIPDKNCLMYKPKDVQKLQENILKLVVDKELRDYLSKNGEKKANEFSWEKSTDQLLKVLYGAP
jgi:glycosyltransferase involved in cell wall biosynthesis